MPYFIEFEEWVKDGHTMTAVRILDPTGESEEKKLIAETVYLGAPPGLCFQTGYTFTALRLSSCQHE